MERITRKMFGDLVLSQGDTERISPCSNCVNKSSCNNEQRSLCVIYNACEKLLRYEKAEADGRLILLPVKPDEPYYEVSVNDTDDGNIMEESDYIETESRLGCDGRELHGKIVEKTFQDRAAIVLAMDLGLFDSCIFLSKEEARNMMYKALKETGGNA